MFWSMPANAARLAPLAAERGIRLVCLEEEAVSDGPATRRPWPELRSPEVAPSSSIRAARRESRRGLSTRTGASRRRSLRSRRPGSGAPDDAIPNVLPLHHTHGLVNVTLCALANGARVEMLAGFDAEACWRRLEEGGLTLFMAVPTVYAKLAAAWDAADHATRARRSEACRRLRLMVSGSAALPVPLFSRWEELSGHRLLERYGMTEIGMALSNPLRGDRVPGTVGSPLPGVRVRLVDEEGEECSDGVPGELRVSGPTLFREYHGRPEETAKSFADGWFLTGDVAVRERGAFRILGRASMDILKSGGYKLSALEIEEALRLHPAIRDVAVVGLPDEEWGERVAAAIVAEGEPPTLEALRAWARDRLAPYKVPSRLVVVSDLPRNAMGKVTKPAVKTLFELGAHRR